MDLFSISMANYFNKALATLESHRAWNPGARHHLVLCEKPEVVKTLPIPPWLKVRTMFDIGMPHPEKVAFQYDLLELATAIKPFVFRQLFADGAKEVTYIDPDIRIYSRLYKASDFDADACVTPHLFEARDDGMFPHIGHVLRCGAYNFGYLSLMNTRNAGDFLAWWADTLLTRCVKDASAGVFVDQSWGAAITSLMSRVHIERRPGAHAAYWNLRTGDLAKDDQGRYTVRGNPLILFHFSGLDPLNPVRLSCHSERFNPIPRNTPLFELVKAHTEDIQKRCGVFQASKVPYSFANYDNGAAIPMAARRAVLEGAGDPAGNPFRQPLPAAQTRNIGFRESYVRRSWQLLGATGRLGGALKVALYGAGKHTDWLAHTVAGCSPAPSIVAVLDDGPPRGCGHFGVRMTSQPESHREQPPFDAVLTSTDVPANAARMRDKARKIYGNKVKVFDLYEGCPPGQYV